LARKWHGVEVGLR